MSEKIDKSMFDDWMKHQITLEVFSIIREFCKWHEEAIINKPITCEEDVSKMILMKGALATYRSFLAIKYEDIEESLKRGEQDAAK